MADPKQNTAEELYPDEASPDTLRSARMPIEEEPATVSNPTIREEDPETVPNPTVRRESTKRIPAVQPVDAKAKEVYQKAFEATKGSYEDRSAEARKAVTTYHRTTLGEAYRKQLAGKIAEVFLSPESGEPWPNLEQLSKEKIVTWLGRYRDDLPDALVSMFRLDPKNKMTKDELALFASELKDPAHVQQKTFFTLSDWLSRVKRKAHQSTEVDEAVVVDGILSGIASNLPPAEFKFQKVA